MKSAEKEQTRTNKGLPWLGCIRLLNSSVPRTGLSTITVKWHSSPPELSAAQEPQKCLLCSHETFSGWKTRILDFCIAQAQSQSHIQKVPDTQQYFTKCHNESSWERNTHDYFPKSAAEEYTLNFIKPTWETQTQHQTALFSSMCFIYNSLNAAGNVTFKYLGFCYVLT